MDSFYSISDEVQSDFEVLEQCLAKSNNNVEMLKDNLKFVLERELGLYEKQKLLKSRYKSRLANSESLMCE